MPGAQEGLGSAGAQLGWVGLCLPVVSSRGLLLTPLTEQPDFSHGDLKV